MAYVQTQQDAALIAEFYTKEITTGKPRTEEWVRILLPGDSRLEHHAPARAVWAPHTDGNGVTVDVTYAERFADQYKAFKDGSDAAAEKRIANLRAQLAAAEAGVKKPDNKPASPYADMSDDDLRALITEKAGKAPGGNSTRETLERMAKELGA